MKHITGDLPAIGEYTTRVRVEFRILSLRWDSPVLVRDIQIRVSLREAEEEVRHALKLATVREARIEKRTIITLTQPIFIHRKSEAIHKPGGAADGEKAQ